MAISSPRASTRDHPIAPVQWFGEDSEHIRKVAEVINNLIVGRTNATGTVTLTQSDTTTTLTDTRIGPNTVITFQPTTANAATATGNLYVSSIGKQTATLTHANTADADKTFKYVLS